MNLARRAAAALVVLACSAQAGGDPESGRVKANTCMGCHGIPGYTNAYPTYRVPRIGGQSAGLIVTALKAYQSGERPHATMRAQAANLSEQDMLDIAAYLTQAPAHPGDAGGEGENSALDLAEPCAACHGPSGAKPIAPDYPLLAGQHRNYLVHALHEYRDGARRNPVMASQIANLSEQDIEALARYFSAQASTLYTPRLPGELD